jgi:Bacteriophage abortive infection AbiH
MKIKSKNLILLIGNGFDLAHEFKTSYNDFSNYIIEKKLTPQLLNSDNYLLDNKNTLLKKEFIYDLKGITSFNQEGNLIQQIYYYKIKKDSLGISKALKSHRNDIRDLIKNIFLGKLFYNNYVNWFDIENAYFHELVSIHELYANPKEQIITLNENLIEIKNILFEYLKSIQTDKNHYVDSFFKSKYFTSYERVYAINFNYTITLENYIESRNGIKINYIHGDIESEDIIFGYGNDKHINYKKLKLTEIDEYLKFFKTFQYLNNNKYLEIYDEALEKFEDYEVSVLGHSLGQTDKTLLKEILDNPKCKQIFLYKRSDLRNELLKVREEFNKLIFSISRIIDNEKDMRVKVLNFEDSTFFP